MSDSTSYAVIWCDSPLGLISLRVDMYGKPVLFTEAEIPPEIERVTLSRAAFDILRKKDGTKIAVPYPALYAFFGWEV